MLLKLFDNKNIALQETFTELLVHYQNNLIKKMFRHEQHGASLKEQLLPLYYVTELLTGRENNIELRIPPELQETVTDIIKYIAERQKVYYPEISPEAGHAKKSG